MPITGTGKVVGRNSTAIRNSVFSPARIETLPSLGTPKTSVTFDVVARDGAFTDTTIANYAFRGQGSSLGRYVLNDIAKRTPNFLKGELTTQFDGITPKTLNFDIILRADEDQTPAEINFKIRELQSLCYPRNKIGLNPPLCLLHILNLYSLECFVQQVLVNWHNQWSILDGIPMGADISISVLMHQYPTREEVLLGSGFKTTNPNGYSGTFQSGAGVPNPTFAAEALRRGTVIPGGV